MKQIDISAEIEEIIRMVDHLRLAGSLTIKFERKNNSYALICIVQNQKNFEEVNNEI